MVKREFIKMHGLGNDFVIVDAQARPISIDATGTRRLSDRHTGIGFDQLITIEAAPDAGFTCAIERLCPSRRLRQRLERASDGWGAATEFSLYALTPTLDPVT